MVTTARQLYEFLCSRVRKDSCTRQRLISRVAAQSRDDDIRISVHFCTQRMLLTRRHLRRSLRNRSLDRAPAVLCTTAKQSVSISLGYLLLFHFRL